MQFVQAPCYATMGKLSDINDIFNRRKNVFHLSEFSAKSENPIEIHIYIFQKFKKNVRGLRLIYTIEK